MFSIEKINLFQFILISLIFAFIAAQTASKWWWWTDEYVFSCWKFGFLVIFDLGKSTKFVCSQQILLNFKNNEFWQKFAEFILFDLFNSLISPCSTNFLGHWRNSAFFTWERSLLEWNIDRWWNIKQKTACVSLSFFYLRNDGVCLVFSIWWWG